MKKYLFILTALLVVGCSSEASSEVDISNLSSKESLESAKDEISDLKKSLLENEDTIDSFVENISIINENVKNLSDDVLSTQSQLNNLMEENNNLKEENLLLQMSLRNLRTQYEAPDIEKSSEKIPSTLIIPPEKEIKDSKDQFPNNTFLNRNNLRIEGSDSVYPYINQALKNYTYKNLNDNDIEITQTGQDEAFEKFLDGEIQIAMASSKWHDEKTDQLEDKKINYTRIPISWYGLAFIVNKNNKLDCLTRRKLSNIWIEGSSFYSWNQIEPKLANSQIQFFGHPADSYRYDKFTGSMHSEKEGPKELRRLVEKQNDIEVRSAINQLYGGFGFISINNINPIVKAINLTHNGSVDNPTDCQESNYGNASNPDSNLPFSWQYFLYVNHDVSDKLTYDFLEYYLSNAQEIVKNLNNIDSKKHYFNPYVEVDYEKFWNQVELDAGNLK